MEPKDVLTQIFDEDLLSIPEEVLEAFPEGQDFAASRANRMGLECRLAAQLDEKQQRMLGELGDLYLAASHHYAQCFYRIGFARGISVLDNQASVLYAAGWRPSNQMLDKMTRTTGTN